MCASPPPPFLFFLLFPTSITLSFLLFFLIPLPISSSTNDLQHPVDLSQHPLSVSPQLGCLRFGTPMCCAGRNMSCKSLDEPRRPIFSFALRDDRVREVRFGKNCIGRIVLPDLVSLNERGEEILRQLGHREHFRLYSAQDEQRRIGRAAPKAADWDGSEETVIQFGWNQPIESEDRAADHWRMDEEDNSPIVRYSLLSKQLPLRIVKRRLRAPALPRGRQAGSAGLREWSLGEPWRMHFLMEAHAECFCDEFCTDYGDCCADYVHACPPMDCQVSGWSEWSECSPDDGICGVGMKERKRVVVQTKKNAGIECPELVERVGCFKHCSSSQFGHGPHMTTVLDTTTVALLLDYQYNASRKSLPSIFFKQQKAKSRREIKNPEKKKDYVKYCANYRIEWLNRECTEREWSAKLAAGQVICAECQPEAQFHRPTARCASDLEDGQTGFWKLIGPKYCYGIWRRLYSSGSNSSSPDCNCAQHFPRLHPFLLV